MISGSTRIPQMEPLYGREEKEAVLEYLDSGGYLTEYKLTKQFERMIADFTGSKFAVVTSSGTTALMCAVMSLGLERTDEVMVPDFTMVASANSVTLGGARPVLVDIDPKNLCMDLEQVQCSLTERTKAVMLVSLNGRCLNMEELGEFISDNDLVMIEDAAQSLGSKYGGKHLGTFGKVGCFSFSFPKIITTGQGGAVVTDDADVYDRLTKIKDFGRIRSGMDRYVMLGFNAKFTDLQAAVGIEQIKKLPDRIKRKKEIYALYADFLANIEGLELIETDLSSTTPWYVDILLKQARDRKALSDFLDCEGIGTRPFYPAIHTQEPYLHSRGDFRNSEDVSRRGLWLPSSLKLTDEQIKEICSTLRSFSFTQN